MAWFLGIQAPRKVHCLDVGARGHPSPTQTALNCIYSILQRATTPQARAVTTPLLQMRKTEAQQGQVTCPGTPSSEGAQKEQSRNGSEPRCWAYPQDQQDQPLPIRPLPLGAREAQGCGLSPPGAPPAPPPPSTSSLSWAAEGNGRTCRVRRGLWASVSPCAKWGHWTRWPQGAFPGLRSKNSTHMSHPGWATG